MSLFGFVVVSAFGFFFAVFLDGDVGFFAGVASGGAVGGDSAADAAVGFDPPGDERAVVVSAVGFVRCIRLFLGRWVRGWRLCRLRI